MNDQSTSKSTALKPWERCRRAYELREWCGMSFRQVGQRLGITSERARQLHKKQALKLKNAEVWMAGLSTRTANCLIDSNIYSREEALKAYEQGQLVPLKHPRNYGWVCHKELARWLGLPEPKKRTLKEYLEARADALKVCPHCHKDISMFTVR